MVWEAQRGDNCPTGLTKTYLQSLGIQHINAQNTFTTTWKKANFFNKASQKLQLVLFGIPAPGQLHEGGQISHGGNNCPGRKNNPSTIHAKIKYFTSLLPPSLPPRPKTNCTLKWLTKGSS